MIILYTLLEVLGDMVLSPIHQPTDNNLLWDAMQVMVRLLRRAQSLPGASKLPWRNHRLAKKRARAVEYSRGQKQRLEHYKVLIRACRTSLEDLRTAATMLADIPAAGKWRAEYSHNMPLICRIIEQAERRVLHGKQVPAAQKLVSLFEPHTDIIRKGGREEFCLALRTLPQPPKRKGKNLPKPPAFRLGFLTGLCV